MGDQLSVIHTFLQVTRNQFRQSAPMNGFGERMNPTAPRADGAPSWLIAGHRPFFSLPFLHHIHERNKL